MVKTTRKFHRTRHVYEVAEITVDCPSWFTPGHIERTFEQCAEHNPDVTWEVNPDKSERFVGIHADEDHDDDEPIPARAVARKPGR